MTSPTQRTLQYLRKHGAVAADVVEKWIPGAKIRRDLFGCLDLLAIVPVNGKFRLLGIQATSASNIASRQTKMEGLTETLVQLFQCGVDIQCWGWRQASVKTKRGKTVKRWKPTRRRAVIGYEGIEWETVEGEVLI